MPLDPRKHDAGDYIDDFMKSDAPQFKGKSKEQIRKMAIAAYLDAKREKGMEEGKLKQDMLKRQDMAKLASLYSKAMRAMPGSPKQKALKKQIDQYRRELGLNEASIYREYEPGEDYQRDLKYFQTVIKRLRGKVKSMNKPTRRDPYLEIEVDGIDAKKLRKEIMKDDDGMTQVDESVNEYGGPKISRKDYLKQKPMDEGLKDGYIVYKKIGSGINKIKKVATLKTMPKGKALDKVLDKYDADGVMAMSKALRNKVQVEAVDADDTGGEEEVNMAMKQVQAMRHFLDGIESRVKEQGDMEEWYQNKLTKANDYLKTLYSYGKGDKVQEAVSPAQQAAIAIAKKEKGEKPKEESRAYRDAMRGMKSRSATRGMATTKKDRDNEASDDDRKAASKNIIMQLRKAADSMTGADVEFEKGKGKVSRSQAQDVLAKFNRLSKPRDKEQMQKSIKSLADIKKILGR